MARLSGQEREDLQAAIVATLDQQALRQLLVFRLDKTLESVANVAQRYPAVVFEVIDAAEREGWTAELLRAVIEERPKLRALGAQWLAKLDAAEAEGDALPILETQSFEPRTVPVPAGAFWMGDAPGPDIPEGETLLHEVTEVAAYYIGMYPVTNDQYRAFVEDEKRLVAPEMRWHGQSPPKGKANHPVNGVTWYDALAYCRWLSGRTGRDYTLPNEAQWEKAARGTDGRAYPWGNGWDPALCHHDLSDTAPVDAYPPQGVYGCHDLVGNVREWTCSLWGDDPRAPDERYRYPWRDDGRNNLDANSTVRRVYRGGASDRPAQMRCAYRASFDPRQPGPPGKRHGFRVALTPRP